MQKKLTLPSGDYLVVSVEKEAYNFKIFNDTQPYVSYFVDVKTFRLYLENNEKYEIIGLASQITEEQAKEIVSESCIPVANEGYVNYLLGSEYYFFTALESFHSWLKANELFLENPIPEPEGCPEGGYDDSWIDAYNAAQQNVYEELLILKIMK